MKIAIIGRGTAGALAISDLQPEINSGTEIDWYFDPNINPQPVGEGTTLNMPNLLNTKLNLNYDDLTMFDYCPKEGIYYYGWGNKDSYFHYFPMGHIGLHFNAVKFQEYIYKSSKNHKNIKIIEKNVFAEEIDADYIIDCSGKPKNLNDDYEIPEFICVNAVNVTQCYWDYPKFRHTKTIARPYGWVFMVPLNNRCSVGYLYNRNFNNLDEIKEDVNELFYEWGLIPSNNTNSFHFNNYYKKETIKNQILYTGNKGFFLEPMEATSIDTTLVALKNFKNYLQGNITENEANKNMHNWFKEVEFIIMIHYSVGSKWKTNFWEYAQDRGKRCIEKFMNDHYYYNKIKNGQLHTNKNIKPLMEYMIGPWSPHNLEINLNGLNLELI
jgi:hypothetical protein